MKKLVFLVLGTCVAFAACGGDSKVEVADGEGDAAGEGGASSPNVGGSRSGSGGRAGSGGPGIGHGGMGGGSGPGNSGGVGGDAIGSDGGATGSDGGATGSDGGATASDGGATGSDAGATGSDGGATGSDGGQGGASTCEVGQAQSPAAPGSLDLFGQIAYFGAGDELPAGRYRVDYVDGCMKYASDQAWAIHAYANGTIGWWMGTTAGEELVLLPGTVGISSFVDFEDCVAANAPIEPIEFDFAGGKLGVWLKDSNYVDNVAGIDGRNPIWKLTLLDGACQ